MLYLIPLYWIFRQKGGHMMIPKIGITTVNHKNPVNGAELSALGWTYIDAVSGSGGLPLLLPSITDEKLLDGYVEVCDGFIFSGGIDVSPCCYGEMQHPLLGETSLKLDISQIGLAKKVIAARKPFIAICRGNQVLNVACGGTLYQDNSLHGGDIAKHMQKSDRGDISHQITILEGSALHEMYGDRIWINSYHHQSIKAVGEGLRTVASADDGIIEAVEMTDYPYGMGIQWHPEVMLLTDEAMKPLFDRLIQAAESPQ